MKTKADRDELRQVASAAAMDVAESWWRDALRDKMTPATVLALLDQIDELEQQVALDFEYMKAST